MQESTFIAYSEKILEWLAEQLEEALDDEDDVLMQDGVLEIVLADQRVYLINRHVPSKEIWVSSPISGARHFALDQSIWRASKDNSELFSLLVEEFQRLGRQAPDLADPPAP